MIKESFAAKCFVAGLGLGAAIGSVAAYEDYSHAEDRNGEVAMEFLGSQDYLQGYIDEQYIRVNDELDSTEQWLGSGCLRLMNEGYGQLDSLSEIQEASECTVSRELRDAAKPLINDLREEHEILEYYATPDERTPVLDYVADDAKEALEDSQNTGYMEIFGSEDTEIIAVQINDQGKIDEVHSDKPNRAKLIIILASLVTGGIAGFAGDKYRKIENARRVREAQKHIVEEAERAAIDNMVQSETFDMDLMDKDEFWNRMDR